jgi:predicted nucleic acid-binding protein
MLIPDVNILIYAHNSRAREYAQARDWWENTLA